MAPMSIRDKGIARPFFALFDGSARELVGLACEKLDPERTPTGEWAETACNEGRRPGTEKAACASNEKPALQVRD